MNETKNNIQFPRPGSAEYNLLFAKDQEKSKILKRWKSMNKYFTIPLYRAGILQIFGMGRIFLLLYTKGRKTGKEIITPVEYRRKDGIIHVVSGRGKKAHWFKNLLANPHDFKIKLGFKKFTATFEVIEDITEKNNMFQWYVVQFPTAAKMLFGWDPKNDDPATANFTPFSELVEVIKIYPEE
jgi:deazaflavin-dependent oxidoreductase (nitroreductase family)